MGVRHKYTDWHSVNTRGMELRDNIKIGTESSLPPMRELQVNLEQVAGINMGQVVE